MVDNCNKDVKLVCEQRFQKQFLICARREQEGGRNATISKMKKPFNNRKPAELFMTHTEFIAQDGPFMMMGTAKEMTTNVILTLCTHTAAL